MFLTGQTSSRGLSPFLISTYVKSKINEGKNEGNFLIRYDIATTH